MRARLKQSVALSSSTAEAGDLGAVAVDLTTDVLLEGGTQRVLVPAAAVDQPLQYGSVAQASLLHLMVEPRDKTLDFVEVLVKRNSTGGEAWPVCPLPGQKRGVLCLSTRGLTAVYLSNPGTVAVEVVISLAGD